MGEYKAQDGQTYRYNPQTGRVELLSSDGWLDVQTYFPGNKTTPIYTSEGFFENTDPSTNGMAGHQDPAPPPDPQPLLPNPTAPQYTPGMNFGSGQIAGGKRADGSEYQRTWFQSGPDKTDKLNDIYYDKNFDDAFQLAMNQFGGSYGSDYAKFMGGYAGNAKRDYQNSVAYDPSLHVSNFLDEYAPQIKGLWDLMGSQGRGQRNSAGIAGRAMY